MTNDDAERAALIAGLKVGDRVLIDTSGPDHTAGYYGFVKRTTAAHVVIGTPEGTDAGAKFNKRTGRIAGAPPYWREKIAAPSFIPKLERASRGQAVVTILNNAMASVREGNLRALADHLRYALSVVKELAKETPDA